MLDCDDDGARRANARWKRKRMRKGERRRVGHGDSIGCLTHISPPSKSLPQNPPVTHSCILSLQRYAFLPFCPLPSRQGGCFVGARPNVDCDSILSTEEEMVGSFGQVPSQPGPLSRCQMRMTTADNYQGRENHIVIANLVRDGKRRTFCIVTRHRERKKLDFWLKQPVVKSLEVPVIIV